MIWGFMMLISYGFKAKLVLDPYVWDNFEIKLRATYEF